MQVLVVAAHPDDEVLGCGGTMARLSAEGHDVVVAILGEGATSRAERREQADHRAVDELQAQSRRAAAVLGVREVHHHGLPDNRFDTVPLLDIVKILEAHVRELRPDVVYTQHGGDLNIDHQRTYRATLTASRPVPGARIRELYAYEVPSSTDWAFQRCAPVFRPNVFADISATLERKTAAMQAYAGETAAFPHPRSLESLRALAVRWGSVAGVPAAEAFELVRAVR